MNHGIIATTAGLLASTCGYPGPAPAEFLPVPSITFWELSKGVFPRSCCLCSCLGNSLSGLNLKPLVLREKELSRLQCSSRSPGKASFCCLERADLQYYGTTVFFLLLLLLGLFFFLALLLLCFAILGDVSSVFKLLLCCPNHFAPVSLLPFLL